MGATGAEQGVHGHIIKHITHKRVLSLKEPLLRERLLAEFVGTFFLMLTIGVGVAGGGPLAPVAIGLALGVQIFTFAAVSGAFFNPAVTLAVYLSGRSKIGRRDAALYMAVQFLGAFTGACWAYLATDCTFAFNYTKWWPSLVLETLFTMMLAGAVLATGTSNDAPNHYFGFAIGLSVTAGALASGGFDQGSFNPAVTFGANLVNYMQNPVEYLNAKASVRPNFCSWAIFLLAPFLGGVLAAVLFAGTRGNEFRWQAVPACSEDEAEAQELGEQVDEEQAEAAAAPAATAAAAAAVDDDVSTEHEAVVAEV